MTALAAPADRPWRAGDVAIVGVAASTRIHQGGIVELTGGHAAPATAAAGKRYFGVALESVDNRTGPAGARTVRVRRRGAVYMQFSAGHKPAVGAIAYLDDDSTVGDQAGGHTALGLVVGADDDGVWVDQEVTS